MITYVLIQGLMNIYIPCFIQIFSPGEGIQNSKRVGIRYTMQLFYIQESKSNLRKDVRLLVSILNEKSVYLQFKMQP